jgi:Ser/Thr protein kinase RdoA (MazF antagonist)
VLPGVPGVRDGLLRTGAALRERGVREWVAAAGEDCVRGRGAMRAFETLGFRGQVSRLGRLAEAALESYGIAATRLVLLAHMENTTFRVETRGGARYLLRIHRTTGSPFQPPRSVAEVRSELIWLRALVGEAGLAVPEPVPTVDGALLTVVEVEGVPGPRICALFRWGAGRFVDAGLTPSHLERVGGFIARLHDQASGFSPPAGFERWRRYDVSDDVAAYAVRAVGDQCGGEAVSIVGTTIDLVRQTERELGEGPEVFGLIHGDLHQENYLFDRGRVRAIDFDDCGWGHFVYDLTVTLSELRWRPDYHARRAGLLRGYRAARSLPIAFERHVEVFHGLRLLQLMLWFLDHRHHPGFADWEAEVRTLLADLEAHTKELTSSN